MRACVLGGGGVVCAECFVCVDGGGGVSVWVHACADVVGCVHMALASAGRIALCTI